MERSADWLDQAMGNLAHAESDVERGFYDWACFSAHQAAEMALKAVFQRHGAVAWGHSVADLLASLEPSSDSDAPVEPDAHGQAIATLRSAALELDKAYIPTRYPDAHPSGSPRDLYSLTEAQRLVEHARSIVQLCTDLLSAA